METWKNIFGGLRANSNSNSKLELDDFEPSLTNQTLFYRNTNYTALVGSADVRDWQMAGGLR